MLKIKKSSDRGYNKISWLESYHSFSFANYFNPKEMNFSHLRVINEDKIAPRSGFGFHPHKDMEIITFMIAGQIEHKDNMGNVGILKAGNAQLMRAGTGVVHSEMNNFDSQAHLLQIWINSEEINLKPGWWEKQFTDKTIGAEVIVEPIHKSSQINKLNPAIQSKGLQMARNGYIVKISKDTQLDFSKFGQSEVYFHQATGQSNLVADYLSVVLNAGDAAMGDVSNLINIKTQDILLVFIFPL